MSEIHLYFDHLKPPAIRKRELKALVLSVFSGENVSVDSVNVIFIGTDEMIRLNKQFLEHDYDTDVISFHMQEPDAPVIGEIYISIDQARKQALEYNVRLEEELRRLAVHGALHLCGYDDQAEADQLHMREKENFYLKV